MTVDDLVKHYGADNDSKLGQMLNVSKSTISKWRSNGIPAERQAVYEVLSKNKLKADLSEFELNPIEEA